MSLAFLRFFYLMLKKRTLNNGLRTKKNSESKILNSYLTNNFKMQEYLAVGSRKLSLFQELKKKTMSHYYKNIFCLIFIYSI